MASKSTVKPARERLRYDTVLKDLFQRDRPKLLERLTGGKRVKQTLNVELAMVAERRADLLLELDDVATLLTYCFTQPEIRPGSGLGVRSLT